MVKGSVCRKAAEELKYYDSHIEIIKVLFLSAACHGIVFYSHFS